MEIDYERRMTPQKIKEELDKIIIGQDHVKRAIAVALSNFIIKIFYIRNKVQKKNAA